MKRCWIILCLLLFVGRAVSQDQYPKAWESYTGGGYFAEIQSDFNTKGWSESAFVNQLLNFARTNLAKQLKVQVSDHAVMSKQSFNGRTSVRYQATTEFSTDLELKLVETRTHYDPLTKEGFAIAFIDKAAARRFYANEVQVVLNGGVNALTLADNYAKNGFKARAQAELQQAIPTMDKFVDLYMWLSFFDYPQEELAAMMEQQNAVEQAIKQTLADLEHATVVCVVCKADLFGSAYPLQNELKGTIAIDGCSFTDNPKEAQWLVTVRVQARKSHTVQIGSMTSYIAYLDAEVTIDKQITNQRIYENAVTVKGGHPRGYSEAARAGFKELKAEIGKIMRTNITQ